MSKISLARIW